MSNLSFLCCTFYATGTVRPLLFDLEWASHGSMNLKLVRVVMHAAFDVARRICGLPFIRFPPPVHIPIRTTKQRWY